MNLMFSWLNPLWIPFDAYIKKGIMRKTIIN